MKASEETNAESKVIDLTKSFFDELEKDGKETGLMERESLKVRSLQQELDGWNKQLVWLTDEHVDEEGKSMIDKLKKRRRECLQEILDIREAQKKRESERGPPVKHEETKKLAFSPERSEVNSEREEVDSREDDEQIGFESQTPSSEDVDGLFPTPTQKVEVPTPTQKVEVTLHQESDVEDIEEELKEVKAVHPKKKKKNRLLDQLKPYNKATN